LHVSEVLDHFLDRHVTADHFPNTLGSKHLDDEFHGFSPPFGRKIAKRELFPYAAQKENPYTGILFLMSTLVVAICSPVFGQRMMYVLAAEYVLG